jgi:hypothetical protein
MAERPRHRLFNHHFAELAHDKEGDNPGDGVPSRTDGPAMIVCAMPKNSPVPTAPEGDQLDVAVF